MNIPESVRCRTGKPTVLFVIDEHFDLDELLQWSASNIHIIFYSDDLEFLDKVRSFLRTAQIGHEISQPKHRLSEIARQQRRRYVDFINSLGSRRFFGKKSIQDCYDTKRYGSIWFYTQLYEKNTIGQKPFHHFCFLKYVQELLEKNDYHQKVIAVDDALLVKSLRKLLRSPFTVKTPRSINFFKRKRKYFSILRYIPIFLKQKVMVKKALGNRKPEVGARNLFFIYYPFVGKKELKNGYLRSNYFKEYQEDLEGRNLFVGNFITNSNYSFREFLSDLSAANNRNNHFLIVEFISIRTFLLLLCINFYFLMKSLSVLRYLHDLCIDGIDLSPQLRRDLIISFTTSKVINCLFFNIVANRTEPGKDVLYLFENLGWERSLAYSCHSVNPDSKVLAYQHCPFGDNYLHFYHDKNLPRPYRPDAINTIGKVFESRLICDGWPGNMLKPVTAYRYRYLKDIKAGNDKENSVLILYSIDPEESRLFHRMLVELLNYENASRIDNVYFRTHPALPKEKFMASTPEHWRSANEQNLLTLLCRIKCVVAGQGGVVLESLLSGNTILQPVSNHKVNMAVFTSDDFDSIIGLDGNIVCDMMSNRPQTRRVHFAQIFNG